MASFVSICAVLTATLPTTSAYQVSIVEQGKPAVSIVIPANATATLKTAAGEIAAYVEKISGAKLGIVPPGAVAGGIVLEVSPAGLTEEDAFRIVTRPGEVRLIGGGPMGALYAAYAFLEDLGVRWLVPGDEGEHVPRATTINYPQTERTERPSFRCRFFYVHTREALLWAVRNRLNGFFPQAFAQDHGNGYYLPAVVSSIHSFADILPPEKYFSQHPDFYALIKGQRVRPTILRNQLCTSHPQVIEIIAGSIRSYFQQTPDARVFSIAPNDGYGWCECPRCQALDEKHCGSKKWYYNQQQPVVSDRLCLFANEIARRAVFDLPGRELYMFSYVNYCEPPQTVRPDKHVTHVICHYIPACYAHPIHTPGCPDNEIYDKYLRGWAAISPQAMVYAYTDKSQWVGLPRPVVRPMAADIRYYYKLGFRKYLAQSGATAWAEAGPLYYVTARLLWNVAQDPESVIHAWNQDMYGAAASEMTAWYDAIQKVVTRSAGHYGGDPFREASDVFTPGCLADAQVHLDKALKLSATSAMRRRIQKVKDRFQFGALGVDALCGNACWERTGDPAMLQKARGAAAELLKLKGTWGGTSMQQFKDHLEGIAQLSAEGVRWETWGKLEEKGGRQCRNSDETGPGDNAAGWASFSTVIADFNGTYRVTLDMWGQSQFSSLLICSQGLAKGSGQGGVWKPLPMRGRLTGKPEWCTLTFSVPPALLDRQTHRQTFGFGGGDSQVWVAEIRFEAVPDGTR
jgi:hypothetical protein